MGRGTYELNMTLQRQNGYFSHFSAWWTLGPPGAKGAKMAKTPKKPHFRGFCSDRLLGFGPLFEHLLGGPIDLNRGSTYNLGLWELPGRQKGTWKMGLFGVISSENPGFWGKIGVFAILAPPRSPVDMVDPGSTRRQNRHFEPFWRKRPF